MNKVFVYGTLRKGGTNAHFLKGAGCISEQCWTYGELHDTGLGYPAIKHHPSGKVYGEIYEVDDDLLVQIDELEDYEEGNEDNLYDRIKAIAYTDEGETEVFVYLGRNQLFGESNIIDHGDWIKYWEGKES